MKRLLCLLCPLLLLLSGCASPERQEDGALHILATTYPLYLFARAVTEGARDVEVARLVTGEVSCLHDYTLTVGDMKAVERADVIILNGAGLEDFMADALARSDAQVVDCSAFVTLLDGEDGEDDPHYWMDPGAVPAVLDGVAAALEGLPGCGEAPARARDARDKLSDWLLAADEEGARLEGRPLITFHDGFQYFARRFGLDLLKSIEEEEGSEASAGEIKEIAALIEEYHIPAIFTEKNGSDATARLIARETGAQVRQLDLIMSGDGGGIEDYIQAMDANLKTVLEALS